MSIRRRRSRKGEGVGFGSDSFLDILANIVGILIILIVLAGLRVRNAPSHREGDAETIATLAERERIERQWLAERDAIRLENERRRMDREREIDEREGEISRRNRLEEERQQEVARRARLRSKRLSEIDRREEVAKRRSEEAEALRREIASLNRRLVKLGADQESARLDAAARRQVAIDERDGLAKQLADARQNGALEAETAKALRAKIEELRKRIAEFESRPVSIHRWEHYPAPVAARLDKREIHYRCLGGKISHTRFGDLLDMLSRRLRESPPEVRFVRAGELGPLDGYRIRFLLANRGSSVAAALRNPFHTGIRIEDVELVAGSGIHEETVDEALAVGSTFLGSLTDRPAGPYAITLWAYPDSFALVKKIQTYLHQAGYVVAIRPLPMGTPIGASPRGSMSMGR